ncbi:MAG: ribonuclease H-like domain-containing protein [Eubacteriales bacterium]|nr:ribonuclease H-like domain-containing protein [Eubacteriales bacterium]
MAMKTIEQTIPSEKTKNLSSLFSRPESVLFLDIETTGFSPKGASVYLIGCVRFEAGAWKIRQFFAPAPDRETEILQAFLDFAAPFETIVHFNGTVFDIPFLQARCKKHRLPVFFPGTQYDIYRHISPYKNLLHLPGCRQRHLEEYMGSHREDPFSGGQLLELYRAYGESREERLLQVLLLHNHDDLEGMTQLFPITAIPGLFEEGGFSVESCRLEKEPDAAGLPVQSALFSLRLFSPLPVPLSLHGTGPVLKSCFLAARQDTALLRLPILSGELRHFYPDYKNYAYLPAEDNAIHKSVAVYVDKSQRMPATAANCYTRKTGAFLPWYGAPQDAVLFGREVKDKQRYVEAASILEGQAQVQKAYTEELLHALSGR